jgi:hypothetical protein
MMALWLVRAGRNERRESLALEEGLAVVGWEDLPDLSGMETREELYGLLEKTYPDEKRKTLLNWLGQIWAFFKRIQPGDLVALPLGNRSGIILGEVTGPYQYRSDLPLNTKHTRPVNWIRGFPRSAFDKDILSSLGSLMTVCRIQRNNAEERVRMMLADNSTTESPMLPWVFGRGGCIHVLDLFKVKDLLVVVMGADDPSDLESLKAKKWADTQAKIAGFNEFLDAGIIRTFGQNLLAQRKVFLYQYKNVGFQDSI